MGVKKKIEINRKRIRSILKRSDGICEQCFEGDGKYIHRIPYTNEECKIVDEFLLYCDGCHENPKFRNSFEDLLIESIKLDLLKKESYA